MPAASNASITSRGTVRASSATAGPLAGFVPNEEVDRLEWLPVAAARGRMSYSRDHSVLDDFASGPADTFPCILVRHAAAGTKSAWQAAGHADDLLRPLDAQGARDADLLAVPRQVDRQRLAQERVMNRLVAALDLVPLQVDEHVSETRRGTHEQWNQTTKDFQDR